MSSPSISRVECYRCGNATPSGLALCQKCGAKLPPQTLDVPPATTTASSATARDSVTDVLLRDQASPRLALSLFAVPIHKFLILSFCTAGLYQGLWIYANWARLRRRESKPLSPFWRTVFSALWNFELFPAIRRIAESEGVAVSWQPALLAALYLGLGAAWRLPDPWSWVSVLNLFVLLPIVHTIGQLPSSRGFRTGFTFWDIVVVLVFGPIVGLVFWVELFEVDWVTMFVELITT